MKKLTIFLISNIILLLPTSSSFAHAFVTDSFPKSNETVTQIPTRVWIEFDGNLATIEGHDLNKLFVYDESGRRIDEADYQVGGARLSVGVKTQAGGKIRMKYRVVSEDGHPVEGEILFKSAYTNSKTSSPTPAAKNSSGTKNVSVLPNGSKTLSTAIPSISKPKVFLKEPESPLKEHLGHLIEFILAALAIFIWSRIRLRRHL